RFVYPREVSDAEVRHAIHSLAEFPGRLREAVESLPDSMLDTPYRPSGWTVRQVVHHCADSHLNALVRFKLALTEASPVIRPYRQDAWAELPDCRMPVGVSLDLLAALHGRWTALLEALTAADWDRPYIHPEHPDPLMLRQAVLQY